MDLHIRPLGCDLTVGAHDKRRPTTVRCFRIYYQNLTQRGFGEVKFTAPCNWNSVDADLGDQTCSSQWAPPSLLLLHQILVFISSIGVSSLIKPPKSLNIWGKHIFYSFNLPTFNFLFIKWSLCYRVGARTWVQAIPAFLIGTIYKSAWQSSLYHHVFFFRLRSDHRKSALHSCHGFATNTARRQDCRV